VDVGDGGGDDGMDADDGGDSVGVGRRDSVSEAEEASRGAAASGRAAPSPGARSRRLYTTPTGRPSLRVYEDTPGVIRRPNPCNCKKSKCLKLYVHALTHVAALLCVLSERCSLLHSCVLGCVCVPATASASRATACARTRATARAAATSTSPTQSAARPSRQRWSATRTRFGRSCSWRRSRTACRRCRSSTPVPLAPPL
jgi:hypothetical protein